MTYLSALRLSAAASAIAVAGAIASPAYAQDQTATPSTTGNPTNSPQTTPVETVNRTGLPTANATEQQRGDIVITGSRIRRPEIESPVPVVNLGQQALLQDAAPNISDTLNELPQVAIGSTRTNTNFLTSGTGVSTVNLRSLGSSRTLTLVNGRRFIAGFAGDSAVDINNIPTDFIDRVEIVTGGSSAVYGSEAIAGVVNFILKDRFDGVQIRAQAGETSREDDRTYLVSVSAGHSLLNDRLHLLGNFSWDKDEGLRSRDRAISAQDCGAVPAKNPNTGLFEMCGPTQYSTIASQGRFQLLNPDFDPSNILTTSTGAATSLFTFDPNNALVGGFPVGSGFNRNGVRLISVPIQRYLGTGIANFDITPSVKFFTELTYAKVKSDASIEPLAIGSDTTPGIDLIGIDNPFIPTAVQNAITAANSDADPDNDVAFVNFRRRSNEIFDRSNHARRHTFRVATGFKGDLFGKYDWEVSYVYGRMHDFNSSEDINLDRYNQALDAIRVGPGNVLGVDIVCRDPAARAAGCIPMNLFGHNTIDPRASAYVAAEVPRSEDIINHEHVATASISGPVFHWWAGDVTAAIGGEYRKESTSDTVDELTLAGLNSGNQLTNLTGKFHVWEGFGEVNVPLLKDLSFTKYLGLTGAARYSDYSTVGHVWSYNIGAEWQPISDLRFRGMYARAVRAPNISELFSQPSQTFAAISDPCDETTATSTGQYAAACRAIPQVAAAIAANGQFLYTLADTQRIDGFIGGNTNLKPETAKTKTLGAVLTPRFVPGLGITVDYYDIRVKGAIQTLGRQRSVEQCLLTGNPVFCSNIIRDPTTGFITRVNGQLINIASLKNRGVDAGLTYGRPLHLLPKDRLTLNVNYTYLIDNQTQNDPSADVDENAGSFGRAFSRHSALGRASYKFGILTFGWETQFLSGGKFLKTLSSSNPTVQELNNVHDYWLHGAQLRIEPSERYMLYFNVDNIFDKKPQLLPGAAFGNPTGLETSPDFDLFGRRFTAGIRVKFF